MLEHGRYLVRGNVVEHISSPRFRAIVSVHDGQSAGIRLVEWVDSSRPLTDLHIKFLMATALLAWSLKHPDINQ